MAEDLDSSVWRREISEFLADFESELDHLMTEMKITRHSPGSERSSQQTPCGGSRSIGESRGGQGSREGQPPHIDSYTVIDKRDTKRGSG